MNDIIVLNITFTYNGIEHIIHPVVLRSDQETVLVDCGYPEFFEQISDALKTASIEPNDLTAIYLTHQDDDHMGTALAFKRRYPHLKIITSKVEAPYVSGKVKNLRLAQAEALLQTLPDEEKAFGRAFCQRLEALESVAVDIEVEEGDRFEWAGGCEVIATPGHTPGHTSLYLHRDKVLITGDAGVIENGALVVANPQFCLDIQKAQESLLKIKNFDVSSYICYHGGRL